ncbi:MAG: fibronectin type III domain-containing protein [Prevotella sp.]|nr:fibronectin type III domain-containing protein [Prevotella sp.]
MKRGLLIVLLAVWSLAATAQQPPKLRNVWGETDSDAAPWATNVSRPNKIELGLSGRHISLWASHGRYFDVKRDRWAWQRQNLFGTNEDLFTQTIVVPYLIPMLERAGAYVFTPRERDRQTREVIVDNDGCHPGGTILAADLDKYDKTTGFGFHEGKYVNGENPFTSGTALVVGTAKSNRATTFTYIPDISEAGQYAVYVSYPYMADAVDDVHYTVCHKGVRTEFAVNQRIGYGTWVYLGTFDFGLSNPKYQSLANCVILSTASHDKGSVGVDAVRFGGGMGNISRNGMTSGLPRCLEGARYSAQWAGVPETLYNTKEGENDYGDDINVRSLMTNWLGGGSCFMPTVEGLGVPIELSLAVHSDAGYHDDGQSIVGSLAICTTDFEDGLLSAGITRQTSLDLASQLLDNLTNNMTKRFGRWTKRYLWDRNYSETRMPEVPSAIIETLSHQSFPDMLIGQHPYGKFAIARSIYATVLRYICDGHGQRCVVEPLPPADFRISIKENNRVELRWEPVNDPLEPSAKPTSYNIYTAVGDAGFDNGQNISSPAAALRLTPGTQYAFYVTACNAGGESFPTPTLSVYISPESIGTALVVDGFERLSAPYVVDNDSLQGFDISRDEGVQLGLYAGWSGLQKCFDREKMGQSDSEGLGYCGNELVGKFVMGNEFNYSVDHTRALASAKKYSVASCTLSALRDGRVKDLASYTLIDLAFGLQKDDGQLGLHFKTFTPALRNLLTDYAKHGGAILASGQFIGSDMTSGEEKEFLQKLFKLRYVPAESGALTDKISGMGMQYHYFHELNAAHYAATHPEVLSPLDGAICAMQYSDGTSAAVGYKGLYSCFAMGFPFECIKEPSLKDKIMQGILAYLLK